MAVNSANSTWLSLSILIFASFMLFKVVPLRATFPEPDNSKKVIPSFSEKLILESLFKLNLFPFISRIESTPSLFTKIKSSLLSTISKPSGIFA